MPPDPVFVFHSQLGIIISVLFVFLGELLGHFNLCYMIWVYTYFFSIFACGKFDEKLGFCHFIPCCQTSAVAIVTLTEASLRERPEKPLSKHFLLESVVLNS